MKKFYYLEIKRYSHLPHGYEFQLADGGDIPRIYQYLGTALFAAKREVEFSTYHLNYKVVIPNEENPACKGDCKFAVRLMKDETDIRKEIRIYEMEINNTKPL